MAGIELVINIPEKMYKNIQSKSTKIQAEGDLIENAILNGTPLPKRHGRLIDAYELKRIIQGNDVLNMTGFNVRICDINATSTIIEADKEESEDKE